MKKPTDIGKNVTGIGMSPIDGKAMMDFAADGGISEGDDRALAEAREEFATEAGIIGTVPIPTTIRGLAKAAAQALKGRKASVFLDKLGERLAFERTGSRLYQALLAKFDALGGFDGGPTRERLVTIHDDELRHLALLADAIEKLGGDPTVVTPSADLGGVEAVGLLQVLTDPRTTLDQCLHAMLVAELVDTDGWALLSELAENVGHDALAEEFRIALEEERVHLSYVRSWLASYVGAAAEPLAGAAP